MLLVTFHGGKGGVKNIYGFSTKDGSIETTAALSVPHGMKLDELRAMAVWGGNLFVVGGSKDTSNVLVFKGPPRKGPQFDYLDTVIGSGQSIAHPFGIAFESPRLPANCYVSNQDSNVVAQVRLAGGSHGAVNGTLGSGCQSRFLNTQYPPPDVFLDGTFVASQNGALAGLPVATDVTKANGGLAVKGVQGAGSSLAPSNSVRDVAISGGILFVCDEVDSQINMYNLNGGALLAPGTVAGNPTHLAISNGGLWVSAGEGLYWSALPASVSGAALKFHAVTTGAPKTTKMGGISFDDSGNVYVVFQDGTGGTGSGSIAKYALTAGSPPSLAGGSTFATISEDTPEFCMWVSDSTWPG
jgi:hypothetical protein